MPWQKGQSGNPKGRPKRKSFNECVQEALERNVSKAEREAFGLDMLPKGSLSWRRALAYLLVYKAKDPSHKDHRWAFEKLLDNLYPPTKHVEVKAEVTSWTEMLLDDASNQVETTDTEPLH